MAFITLVMSQKNLNGILNPLYLMINNRIDGFIEEKEGDKYLNISDINKNSEVLKNILKYGMELKIVLKK